MDQLAVEGTAFTKGKTTLAKPTSNAQKIRTFSVIKIILYNASPWDRILKNSMIIRNEKDNEDGRGIDIQLKEGLAEAVEQKAYDIKLETINGKEYYTREFTAASGTSTWKNGYFIDLWADGASSVVYGVCNACECSRLELGRCAV